MNSKHYYNYFLVRQCTVSMLEHTRRFCHAGGAVSVFMQRLEAPIMEEEGRDRLMMWKYCTQCELITPIGTVSMKGSAAVYTRVMRIWVILIRDADLDSNITVDLLFARGAWIRPNQDSQNWTRQSACNIEYRYRIGGYLPGICLQQFLLLLVFS